MDISPHIEIDRFTSGFMSPEECSQFLSRIETDSHLKELFDADLLLTSTVEHQMKTLLTHNLTYSSINFTESLLVAPTISTGSHAFISYIKGSTIVNTVLICSIVGLFSYLIIHNRSKNINTQNNQSISRTNQNPLIHTIQAPRYIESSYTPTETAKGKIIKSYKTISKESIVKTIDPPTLKKVILENSHSRFRKKIDIPN
jgi:hypothetical protein